MTPQVISLSAAGSTAWIPVDYKQNPFYINLALVLSDTPSLTCKVEYTLDNVFDSSITPTAFTHTGLSSVSTNTTGSITYPIRAFRLTVTAWTSGTVTLTALQGVTNPQIYTTTGSGSLIYRFANWPTNAGYLLASLVAGATASRTSGIVTIIATGHGIPTGVTYTGYRFYYPGSPTLVAGWYDNILTVPDANTMTFSMLGTDFTSESINGGAAWITGTEFTNIVLPGNTLRDQSKVAVSMFRSSSTTATSKTISLGLGGNTISAYSLATAPRGDGRATFRCIGTAQQVGSSNSVEGAVTGSANYIIYKDITQDQILSVKGTIGAASEYIALTGAYMEITQ